MGEAGQMRNFRLIHTGLDVTPILAEIDAVHHSGGNTANAWSVKERLTIYCPPIFGSGTSRVKH